MSALGFGLLVGAGVTAAMVLPRALREPGLPSLLTLIVAFLTMLAGPVLFSGWADFGIGAAILPVAIWLAFRHRIKALDEEIASKKLAHEEGLAAAKAKREATNAAVENWPKKQAGWTHISKGRLMHIKGQPNCFFMISDNRLLLRIVEYFAKDDFIIGSEFTMSVNSVISMNIASPAVTKVRYRAVPIALTETKSTGSPVVRGLVGGALLGTTGVVIGAASGLKTEMTSKVHHEQVREEYETLGDPQLIIGTRDSDRPVLKLKFDPPGLADEWMFRIKGAQLS